MSLSLPFIKMHGLGNDFVILDEKALPQPLSEGLIQHICDRRRGVGCDQLIIMGASASADCYMHIYNPDGSRAGACGNATRCVADLIVRQKGGACRVISIETDAGILQSEKIGADTYSVNMGVPKIFEIKGLGGVRAQFNLPQPIGVDMGNPHCVFFMDYMPNDDTLAMMGRVVEAHETFPNRTNVEFAVMDGQSRIQMRVWERGAGITQACGSGACATLAAAIHSEKAACGADVTLALDGGDLSINWSAPDQGVIMSGPASHVFQGQIDLP